MSCQNYFLKREDWTNYCSHLSSYRMEPNIASGEMCRGKSRSYIISPGCTSVRFFKDKDRPIVNQKYLSSVARVHKSFRTCCLSSDSTCMLCYCPSINSHWSNKSVRSAFPIWTLQRNIQWSFMNSLIWIWISLHQCWIFWGTFHNKGRSYICSHRLYSISTYGINLPPRKLDIRRSKRYISNTRKPEISLLVGLWQVWKLWKRVRNVPSLLFYFIMSKLLRERKKIRVKQLDKGKNPSIKNIKWEHILFNENMCSFFLSVMNIFWKEVLTKVCGKMHIFLDPKYPIRTICAHIIIIGRHYWHHVHTWYNSTHHPTCQNCKS